MATTDAAPRDAAPQTPVVVGRPETAGDWAQAHGRKALLAALVVGALVGSYYVYTGTRNRQAERAERAYFDAQQAMASGNVSAAKTNLQNVANRYGNTPAGVQATILLAQQNLDEKKYAEGIRQLEGAAGHSASKPYRSAIYNLVGSAYEDQSKYGEAAEAYRKAAGAATLESDKLQMLGNQARALTQGKRVEDARKIWQQLADDPSGPMAGEARVRLGELDAKAAGKP